MASGSGLNVMTEKVICIECEYFKKRTSGGSIPDYIGLCKYPAKVNTMVQKDLPRICYFFKEKTNEGEGREQNL